MPAFDVEHNHSSCPEDQLLSQVGQPYRKRGRRKIRYAAKGVVCSACEKRQQCPNRDEPLASTGALGA